MRNILVPTDFSACAANALHAAVQLAQRFDAHLHVMTRLDLPQYWEEWEEDVRNAFPDTLQEINNTRVLQRDLQEQYPEVSMTTSITGGKLVDAINKCVQEKSIDFVVMGSHGTGGKNEFFVGSNTQRVVRMVHCPVLVVKDKIERLNFDKVIFASTFNERDKEAFLKFKNFIKRFVPEIHLVAIHTSSLFDPPYVLSKEAMEDFKDLCAPIPCHTHVYRDFTVERGIRLFASEIGAQLIVLSNHHRHPLKRMLRGSTVEAVINHAGLPVLSIDYEIEDSNDGEEVEQENQMKA